MSNNLKSLQRGILTKSKLDIFKRYPKYSNAVKRRLYGNICRCRSNNIEELKVYLIEHYKQILKYLIDNKIDNPLKREVRVILKGFVANDKDLINMIKELQSIIIIARDYGVFINRQDSAEV